jgi:phasin family protein
MATGRAAGAAKKTVAETSEKLGKLAAGGQEAVDRTLNAVAEVGSFGKENFEAWIASATAASKGIEALSARAAAYSKTTLENHAAAAKSLMTVKSVQELIERQTEYAKSAFEGYVSEVTKMSDLFAGVTKDAIKPLNERAAAVSHLMQTAMPNRVRL